MGTIIDWSKLVAEGRVKAPGIDWTDAELKAIQGGMDPDEVRAGNLKPEDVPAAGKERPLNRMTKPQLVEKAKALKVQGDLDAATRGDLIQEIERILNEKAEGQKVDKEPK